MVINILYAVVAPDQIAGALGTDAGNARDIVGAVALYRLDLYQLRRRHAVVLFDLFGRIENIVAVGAEVHRRFVAHQLQAVAVSGGDHAHIAAVLAGCRERAENIVRLVALAGDKRVAQQAEQLPEQRHLTCQLRRHALARRLVAVKRLVAKGGRLQVKGDGDRVGVFFFFYLAQHGQKAVDRVGELSLLVRQRTDPVERAVDNAVSVNNQ